jgi:hypothetical protein
MILQLVRGAASAGTHGIPGFFRPNPLAQSSQELAEFRRALAESGGGRRSGLSRCPTGAQKVSMSM